MNIDLGGLIGWIFSLAVMFLVVYGAVRLALTHDRRNQVPNEREIADRELRERLAAEREARERPQDPPAE